MRYCPPYAAPMKTGHSKNSKQIPNPLEMALSGQKKTMQKVTNKVFDEVVEKAINKHIEDDGNEVLPNSPMMPKREKAPK
jgi:hypothetical protein